MEILIHLMTFTLIAVGVWTAVVMASSICMMASVRGIRGTNRNADWYGLAVMVGILGWISYVFLCDTHPLASHTSSLIALTGASIFALAYITERHVKNFKSVRAIKRSLTFKQ